MSVYLRIFLQTTFAFITLFLISKVLGKKLISQMTLFDFFSVITLGSLTSFLVIEVKNSPGPIFLALLLWVIYLAILGVISLKNRKIRQFIVDKPLVLVQNGHILEENMGKSRIDLDSLLARLRAKNVFNLADVEFALLETDGQVSVIPKSQKRPVNAADLNISTTYEGLSTDLIIDGQIIYQNLEQVGLDLQWLKDQLIVQKINSVEDIGLAQLDTNGQLYIDLKSDKIQSEIKV